MHDNRQQQFWNREKFVYFWKSLDTDKTHGHDEISIRMIKICASSNFKATGDSL